MEGSRLLRSGEEMRDQIQALVTMLQDAKPVDSKLFMTMVLDVMAAQAVTMEELAKDNRRLKETMEILARGGKVPTQTGAQGGAFSIG